MTARIVVWDRFASAGPSSNTGGTTWISHSDDCCEHEIAQRGEEGCDVSGFDSRLEALLPGDMRSAEALWDALDNLTPQPDFPYREPSTYDGIRAARPAGMRRVTFAWDDEALLDRIYGAWLGRCVGCCLGKPVEGWARQRIEDYLRIAGAYPLDDYVPRLDPMPAGHFFNPGKDAAFRGRIRYIRTATMIWITRSSACGTWSTSDRGSPPRTWRPPCWKCCPTTTSVRRHTWPIATW